MDKSIDATSDLLGEVRELLRENKFIELRELLEEYHVMDIIDVMEELDDDTMKLKLFESLPLDMAAMILEESGSEFFGDILVKVDYQHLKNILELMSLGDMADILKEFEEEEQMKIISYLNDEDAKSVKELLFYEDETAGSTMTKGYICVNKDMNAQQAIKVLRSEANEADTIYYIYVVDDDGVLVGVVSLRELIMARDSAKIEDLMIENIVSVRDLDDREEAVKLVSKYDFVAIPVVNDKGQLKGIITVDDIIDVMEEEATEDMYKFAGSSEHERDIAEKEDSTLMEQVMSSLRGRLLWLIISVVGGVVAAYIFKQFKGLGLENLSVLFFIPLVLGMGGNIGSQAATVTAITLNSKDLNSEHIIKEILVGLITGAICAALSAALIYVILSSSEYAIVIGISVLINMIIGATIGVLIPSVIKKLDADVSTVSTPLLTTVLDITGIVVYLYIATIFITKFI